MKLRVKCDCCDHSTEYDLYGGVDVSALTDMQREIVMWLANEPDKAFRAEELADRIHMRHGAGKTYKNVIQNQIRLMRMAAGHDIIVTTPEGYRLGRQRKD